MDWQVLGLRVKLPVCTKKKKREAKTELQDAALMVFNFWRKKFQQFHVNSVAQVAW